MTKAHSNSSITRALEIAARAHKGQLDKAGVEYIQHPMAVAAYLGMNDTKAVVVALLHDVLKDRKVTEEELAKDFPPEVMQALRALTRMADEDYMIFIKRCAKNPLARKVKIADLRHNMDPERLKKVEKADREQLRAKYRPALTYLLNFIDKDELSRQLFEECRHLPPGTLPHDALNKAAFAHPAMLESFLRFYVDESFMEDVDLEHIEPLPTEFVTEKMSKRYSDCIRKIHWKGHTAYLLIILEFQSTKDVWIPVRILVYTALLWLDVIKYKLVTK